MLFLFFITSLFILLSILGYGLIIINFLKFEKINLNLGITGILGLFFLSIISSYTHLFFPHNYFHNLIVIFFGLLSLVFFGKKKFYKVKYLSFIFSLLFISILMSKTNEDFGYYHLPNSLQFAEQKLQFGLGNLNHGFKHISSLFMLMSLSYVPFFDYYLFNLINLLFLTFFVFFILDEIYLRKNYNLNFSNIILSFFLVLFLVKFSRLAEYGSDLAAQIILCLFVFYVFEYFLNNKINDYKNDYFKIVIILITFAITLKFISVIYFLLLLPFFFIEQNKVKKILGLLRINYLIFVILPISILLFLNFSATGCLVYPVEKLCFSSKYDWALSSETVKYLNFHYELWSKGGLGPGISVNNKIEYIKSLNWISNWLKVYFIGKFTDYILVTLSIVFVFFIVFNKELLNSKIIFRNNNKFILFFLSLLIIFFVWFLNFPSLRYAGYLVVYMLIIFPFAVYANKKIDITKKLNLKKLSVIFLISYTIFIYKNLDRITYEMNIPETNHHNFTDFPFYWVKKVDNTKIEINKHFLYLVKGSCWTTPSTCIKNADKIKVLKNNSYIFYYDKSKN
jgi:hypothetical protein